jgi:hypothetical protein
MRDFKDELAEEGRCDSGEQVMEQVLAYIGHLTELPAECQPTKNRDICGLEIPWLILGYCWEKISLIIPWRPMRA